MKTYNNLYEKMISISNLIFAVKKARKGKTKKFYVIEFQNNFMQIIAIKTPIFQENDNLINFIHKQISVLEEKDIVVRGSA